MIDEWVNKGHTNLNMLVNKSWAKAVNRKVELLKPTTPKNCIFMPFMDTNSHRTTKPYNFDIKSPSNSESYDRNGFFGTKFRGGQNCLLTVGVFSTRESTLGLTGWSLFYMVDQRVIWGPSYLITTGWHHIMNLLLVSNNGWETIPYF